MKLQHSNFRIRLVNSKNSLIIYVHWMGFIHFTADDYTLDNMGYILNLFGIENIFLPEIFLDSG